MVQNGSTNVNKDLHVESRGDPPMHSLGGRLWGEQHSGSNTVTWVQFVLLPVRSDWLHGAVMSLCGLHDLWLARSCLLWIRTGWHSRCAWTATPSDILVRAEGTAPATSGVCVVGWHIFPHAQHEKHKHLPKWAKAAGKKNNTQEWDRAKGVLKKQDWGNLWGGRGGKGLGLGFLNIQNVFNANGLVCITSAQP